MKERLDEATVSNLRYLIDRFECLDKDRGEVLESDTNRDLLETIGMLLEEFMKIGENDKDALSAKYDEYQQILVEYNSKWPEDRWGKIKNIDNEKYFDLELDNKINELIKDIKDIIEIYNEELHFLGETTEYEDEEEGEEIYTTDYEKDFVPEIERVPTTTGEESEQSQENISEYDETEGKNGGDQFRKRLRTSDKKLLIKQIRFELLDSYIKKMGGIATYYPNIKNEIKKMITNPFVTWLNGEKKQLYSASYDGNEYLILCNTSIQDSTNAKIMILGFHYFLVISAEDDKVCYEEINDIKGIKQYHIDSQMDKCGYLKPDYIKYIWQTESDDDYSIIARKTAIHGEQTKKRGWVIEKQAKDYQGIIKFDSEDDLFNLKPQSLFERDGMIVSSLNQDDDSNLERLRGAWPDSKEKYDADDLKESNYRIINEFKGIKKDIGRVLKCGIIKIIPTDALDLLSGLQPDIALKIKNLINYSHECNWEWTK